MISKESYESHTKHKGSFTNDVPFWGTSDTAKLEKLEANIKISSSTTRSRRPIFKTSSTSKLVSVHSVDG